MNIEWLETISSFAVTAIFNGVWIGVLLAGITWGVLRLCAEKYPINATTRFSIWLTAFVLSVGLVGWMALPGYTDLAIDTADEVEAFTIDTLPAALPTSESVYDEQAALVEASQVEPVDSPAAAAPETGSVETTSVAPLTPKHGFDAESVVQNEATDTANAATGFISIPGKIEIPAITSFWRVVLFTIWGTVAGMLLFRIGMGLLGVRLIKGNSYAAPARVQDELNRLLKQMENPRHVRVAISDEIQTAVAAGFFRPSVLLPAHMLGSLSQLELRQVLLHEVAHLQRWDDWTMLVQRFLLALLFFHPGLILLGRLMNRDREFACDDWVIAMTRKPKAYASCLAKLVSQHVRQASPAFVPGFSSPKDELFDRVKTILDKKRTISFRLSRKAYAGLILVMTLLVFASMQVLPVIALPDQQVSSPAAESTLEEDANVQPHEDAETVQPVETPRLDLVSIEPDPAPIDFQTNAEELREPAGVLILEDAPEEDGEVNLASITGFSFQKDGTYKVTDSALPLPRAIEQAVPSTAKAIVKRDSASLSANAMAMLLRSVQRIPSSGDKAQLLIQAANRSTFDQGIATAYLRAVDTIPSSGDKAKTLIAMAQLQSMDEQIAALFLRSVSHIASTGDKTRVLIYSLENDALPLDSKEVRDRCLDVIENISSSSDYRRAMSALLEKVG